MSSINVRFRIEGKEFFDTYKDENVNYTQKVQDFTKIDTSYGDFSFVFNIPATTKNREILDWYTDPDYNPSLAFNPFANTKMEMFLNQTKISNGSFKLINIQRENREPISFRVQYFADATNLKVALNTAVSDDPTTDGATVCKLVHLNWGGLEHDTTKEDILDYLSGDQITNTDGQLLDGSTGPNGEIFSNLKYPMCSQDNFWIWDGDPDVGMRRIKRDPLGNGGVGPDVGILNTEVRPAVKISDVIQRIFNLAKFGTQFKVEFDDKDYYTECYMWMANGESVDTAVLDGDISYSRPQFTGASIPNIDHPIGSQFYFNTQIVDPLNLYNPTLGIYRITSGNNLDVSVTVDPQYVQAQYEYRYQLNGVFSLWYTADGTTHTIVAPTSGWLITDIRIRWTAGNPWNPTSLINNTVLTITGGQGLDAGDVIDPSSYIPDLSCTDFLLGILHKYNAVMYWDNDLQKYIITHKTDWYRAGKEVDITDFVDTSKDTITPPAFIKIYEFGWSKAEDYLSTEYRELNPNAPWGSSSYDTGYKLGEFYKVSNPFTASLWQEVVSIDGNGAPYNVNLEIPSFQCIDPQGDAKPSGVRLMYWNGTKTVGGTSTYTTADDIGKDIIGSTLFNDFSNILDTYDMTLSYKREHNWDVTVPQTDLPFQYPKRSLSSMFHDDYIGNIYKPSIRRTNVTAYLLFSTLQEIKMNDTIVIEGRKYFINTMKIAYNTGRVQFELIDWMPFLPIKGPI